MDVPVRWVGTKERGQKMPRKKIEKQLTLEELVPQYGEQNTQCNALKKVVADLNTKIKEVIHKSKQENKDIEINGWKCSLTVEDKKEMNEDRLLEFCKKHKLDCIKTKEYVDGDALEKLIYAGKISEKLIIEMDKCNDVKTKETLRCVKMKENKNGE